MSQNSKKPAPQLPAGLINTPPATPSRPGTPRIPPEGLIDSPINVPRGLIDGAPPE